MDIQNDLLSVTLRMTPGFSSSPCRSSHQVSGQCVCVPGGRGGRLQRSCCVRRYSGGAVDNHRRELHSNTHALFCKLLLKYFHYCNYLHKRTKKHSIRQNRERKKKHSGSAARTAQKKKKEALERPVWVTVMGPAPHRVLAMLVEIRYCASSPLILLKLVSLGFIWARCVWGARLC